MRIDTAALRRTLTAVVALGAAAGLVAACSSSGGTHKVAIIQKITPAPATSSEPTSALPPAPTSNGPAHPSAPPPVTASAAPSTPATSTAPTSPATNNAPTTPAAPKSTCTSVTVRVIRGSADVGREVAALQFTNAGTSSCVLVGYPGATLMRNGKTFGSPAQPATTKRSRRMLSPGDTAESLLNDFTDCQAPLSEEVEVTVPGSTQSAVRPAQLRACTLRVAALGAPQ
jgi:hypothetical protein